MEDKARLTRTSPASSASSSTPLGKASSFKASLSFWKEREQSSSASASPRNSPPPIAPPPRPSSAPRPEGSSRAATTPKQTPAPPQVTPTPASMAKDKGKAAKAAKGAAKPAAAAKTGVKKTGSRNTELIRGVGKFSRSAMYHKRGLWAIKAKNGGKFPAHEKPSAPDADPAKKQPRDPRFYPAEDVPKPVARRVIRNPTRLRASITPGTVLILLVGQFKGKRVVFLKQLSSGLLLVTGPFKINGVPLRRVNQVYVIATSTKVDVSSVDVSKFDDPYFAKQEKKETKGEGEFFDSATEEKREVPEEKKEDQKAIDAALLPIIEAVPQMKEYLRARFSLKSGQKPHLMKF